MPHGPPPTAGDQFQLLPTAGVAAVMAWWRVLQARVVQLRHRAGATAAGRQPSRTPRQSRPAGIVVACCVWGGAALHRPLGLPQPVQLRCQRPGAVLQVLQVAVAVEGPAVDAAGPAAPIAGLRGARTGVVGLWPTGASMALVDPRSGREADLPGPTGRPAGHQVSPPLAWLPGSDQPAKPAGTAQPEPHGASTVLPGDSACWARAGAAGDPRAREPACPRPRFVARTPGRAGPRPTRVLHLGWLACSWAWRTPHAAPAAAGRCGIPGVSALPRREDWTLRPSPPRGAGWPVRGSRLRGSGDGRRASSGRAACLPWPSGTRSWARRAGCRRPRRPAGSWEGWLRLVVGLGCHGAYLSWGRTPAAVPGPELERLFV
jgi:hypothetical protein